MVQREQLSDSRLYQPVILVVGDFDPERRAGEFAAEVWEGVIAEYTYQVPPKSRPATARKAAHYATVLEDLLKAQGAELRELLSRNRWEPARRPITRTPIPLRLAHGPDADTEEFRNRLRQVLDLFDVWGIIASGSAHNIAPLRDALEGIDVPLLVTTDSTTVGSSKTLATELRLMPSNRAQATVMLLAGALAAARSEEVVQTRSELATNFPRIFFVTETTLQARKYAEDLITQLRAEADRLGIPLRSHDPAEQDDGPLLVVGYDPIAEQVVADRSRDAVTILSDGCATVAVRSAVAKGRPDDADCWFVTAPSVTLGRLGKHSFAAIAEAGGELVMGKRADSGPNEPLAPSLRDRIRTLLTYADQETFVFEGIENVAPLYVVRSLINGPRQ